MANTAASSVLSKRGRPVTAPPIDPLDALLATNPLAKEFGLGPAARPLSMRGKPVAARKGDLGTMLPKPLSARGKSVTKPPPSTASMLGEGVVETGKGLASGAISTSGSVLKGASTFSVIDPEIAQQGADLGLYPIDPNRPIEEQISTGRPQDTPLFKGGEAMQDFAADRLGPGPGWEDSWTRSISQAFGSTALFLVAGLTGPASLPIGTIAGVWAGAGEAMDRAIESGATQEQIMQAARLGNIPGATEQLPIEVLFERVPLPAMGRFAGVLGRVFTKAAVEGGQEGLEQAAQNLIERYIYNPEQDIAEGVAEAAGLGAIVGGGIGAATEPFRRQAAPPAAAEQPQPVPQQAPQAAPPLTGDILPPEPQAAPAPSQGDLQHPILDLQANVPPAQAAPQGVVNEPTLDDVAARVWTPQHYEQWEDTIVVPNDDVRAKFASAIQTAALLDDPEAIAQAQQDFAEAVAAGAWFASPQMFGLGPAPRNAPQGVTPTPPAALGLPPAEPPSAVAVGGGPPRFMAPVSASLPESNSPPLAVPVGQPVDLASRGRPVRGAGTRQFPALLAAPQDVARAEAQVEPVPSAPAPQSRIPTLPEFMRERFGPEWAITRRRDIPNRITQKQYKKAKSDYEKLIGVPVYSDAHLAMMRVQEGAASKKVDLSSRGRPVDAKPASRPIASWIIREKATGAVVMETFDRKKVDVLNTEKYEAVPIAEHLAGLNKPKPKETAVESGADNKPQLVIPGAEKAPDATLAQRKADAPLKPKAEQKPMESGLFGDSAKQTTFLSPARRFDRKRVEELTREARSWRQIRKEAKPDSADWHRAHDALRPISEELIDLTGHPLGFDDPETAARLQAASQPFAPDASIVKAAIKALGLTSDASEAGYILPDGRMLDLSGKRDGGSRGSRDLDHREVGQLYPDANFQSSTDAMTAFMRDTGAVRVDFRSGLFDVIRPPTAAQIRVAVRGSRQLEVPLRLEISRSGDGSSFDSLELERPNAERVKAFFDQAFGGQQALKPPERGRRVKGKSRAEIEREVVAIVRKMSAASDLALPEQVVVTDQRALRQSGYSGTWASISGSYNYTTGLISVAMASKDDVRATAIHESWHSLEALLTKDQVALLRREKPRLEEFSAHYLGWDSAAHMKADGVNLATREIWATAAEAYIFNNKVRGIHVAVRRIFDRLARIIREVRNWLEGQGFKTAEDVFDAAWAGEIKARGVKQKRPPHKGETKPASEALAPRRRRPGAISPARKRQNKMLELLNGQPIDHALRVPFDIFGGTDEFGRWKPGLYLDKKAQKLIVEAKFSDQGRFAALNPWLYRARAGLIDRYGLDKDYIERERQRGLEEAKILNRVPELMETLKKADIGIDEAKVLQAILTGERATDAQWSALSEPIRNAIDHLGQQAVDLGLISAESYERNRGSYLHRVYLKHETDQGGLSRLASNLAGKRRKGLFGSQFKMRGKKRDVSTDRLRINGKDATVGTRFRVLEGRARDKNGRFFRRRVYLRGAGANIPKQFESYRDDGVWTVRALKGGKATIWRDWTKEERQKMGEIIDARYTIAKTYMLMAHDLATGAFYRDIARETAWTTLDPGSESSMDAAEYKRQWADSSVRWVKVPDTTIPKSNTKRWGALAGKYVRAEIWRDIAELEAMQRRTWWDSLLTEWKLNKTARGPVTHMNNVMSNVWLMDMADVRARDLARAIVAMVKGNAQYKEAAEHGAFGSSMVAVELRRNVLEPLLKEIEADMLKQQSNIPITARLVNKLLSRIWSKGTLMGVAYGAAVGGMIGGPPGAVIGAAAGVVPGAMAKNKIDTFDRRMIALYQMEDEVFRMATYIRRRSQGAKPDEAAVEAKEQFLNYDIRAPWVNVARRTGLPFISYTYKATPKVAQSILHRPWKTMKYATMLFAMGVFAYKMFPGDDDEDRERRSLPEWEKGKIWAGPIPIGERMLRMPFGDDYDNPMFLDIRRWVPAGDVFDTSQGQLPVPAPLQPGGPLMIAFEFALNKLAFTGEEIVNRETDDFWDQAGKYSDWLWKSWMPGAPWIPGSWYWEKIERAARGAESYGGRPYGVPEAVASSFGVKLKPQDVDEGMQFHTFRFDAVERDLKSDFGRAKRQHARKMISDREFERIQFNYDRKIENLKKERARVLKGEKVEAD